MKFVFDKCGFYINGGIEQINGGERLLATFLSNRSVSPPRHLNRC
jgi:hypothetical protein